MWKYLIDKYTEDTHMTNETISDANPLKKPLIAQKIRNKSIVISKADINYLISQYFQNSSKSS